MTCLKKIAFWGYVLVAIGIAGTGILYLNSDRIMPYHLAAMGSTWEELSFGMQVMSLNFMKAVGAGMITTGVAMAYLLWFPFRRSEQWANYAILTVALTETLIILARTCDIIAKTPGTPFTMPLFALGGSLYAALFSPSARTSVSQQSNTLAKANHIHNNRRHLGYAYNI